MAARRALAPLLGLFCLPLFADGLEFGLGAVSPRSRQFNSELKGPSLEMAYDLADFGHAHLQLAGGYGTSSTGATRMDMASVGIKWSAWDPDQNCNLTAGLGFRGERVSEGDRRQAFGRMWGSFGLGYRGILVPLFPFPTAVLVHGTARLVPFTRVEVAAPLWGKRLNGLEAATYELRLHIGLRVNLD